MGGMQIDEKDIDEFIEIVKQERGITLSRDEARIHATRLLELYDLIFRPLRWEADPSIPIPESVQSRLDDLAQGAP